eukprot:TRINITY_DN1817_c0_g1_i1.p1 TRINITY_DN1817_c0_g1~~TRINITY_DN1817_c0_g1_i1.p1  ORF type:complete len:341 (-),score=78.69 TRINITY_DN1817_c0_g1_i1:124-1146(-)
MLRHNQWLETLDLNVNDLGDEGAWGLAQAPPGQPPARRTLPLRQRHHRLGDNHLLYGVQQNTTLTFLDLQFDPAVSHSGVQASIQERIRSNLARCLPSTDADLDLLLGDDAAEPPAPEPAPAGAPADTPSKEEEPPSSPADDRSVSPEMRSPLGSDDDSDINPQWWQQRDAAVSEDEDRAFAARHMWRVGNNGGKTRAFVTYSEAERAQALALHTTEGRNGRRFDQRTGAGKVRFFAGLPDEEKVAVLTALGPRRLPPWSAGFGGGKVRAFAHLTEREKCDVLNSLTGPTAKRFHPNKGSGKVGYFASLPDAVKARLLQDATDRLNRQYADARLRAAATD